ncbi:bifunctional 5,10-methylenetetrahydrofolate dehydrogenase/5,10-methenyltetrahydrofolate cyclohydrolase [Candidatus Daviesbacteria bacterium]|nr:bifunctional 5,10-methylenetetrahydrofolate dehydrogenase/5,10-methenyltetrahydrofolate cyclohydrolase [Candidatus Daviesbacteria bacterium]
MDLVLTNRSNNKIIDGRKLAQLHQEKVKQKLAKLNIKPKVVSILIGDDPPSVLYTNMKQKKALEVGIDFQPTRIPATEDYEKVVDLIKQLNDDPKINGIMIQLPIPGELLQGYDKYELLNLINKKKDVDGLTSNSPFLPAVVRAIMEILQDAEVKLEGVNAVVLGASRLVGQPVAKELEKKGAKVIICDKSTPNQTEITKQADVIVSATGVAGLLKGEMVKSGVVVVDVGAEKVNGKLVGDVDFESVLPKASKITPVPGGVGPMTVICLMENVVDAVKSIP